ncbi:hypothetical protein NIIDMKKI_36630 [Mycobacterium kansasii]|uniref:Natural resistance-associated macrophage family protein n=1 Tax=Mycobacterium kansasii TaxID=1768 RepID=A0A7G1IC56_MYCKA|nr:hypothetical protein NIIDMKKI_36630 [Mycobacterium kansasii]
MAGSLSKEYRQAGVGFGKNPVWRIALPSHLGVSRAVTGASRTSEERSSPRSVRSRGRWALLAVWGPGLVVMLADTDAGSLITAAQSGAQWGYRMVLPQLILMPILYVVQEMTVRLGIVTGRGHGALIRERFGRGWAWLSAFTLFASAIGALLTEFVGVAGVGELFGVSRWVSIPIATTMLLALALTGSYRRVERIGLAIGAAELAFLVAMVMARPQFDALLAGLSSMPLGNSSYLLLVAANVGAVIMPWMIFYQQGAVVDKHLSVATIRQARYDTATGAVLTQLIMIAVVLTVAATIGTHQEAAPLQTVGQIAGALTPIWASSAAPCCSVWECWARPWSPRSSLRWPVRGGCRRSSGGSTPSTRGPLGPPPSSTPPTPLLTSSVRHWSWAASTWSIWRSMSK